MKISIIMASYNQGQFVEEALMSVLEQDYEDWELIFIDGGSTDDTMQRVAPFKDRLAYYVSEADNGQSDAMAKGFARASGQLMTWLNTDDLLLPGALSDVARAVKADPACEWFLGNVVWIEADGTILRCRRGESHTRFWPRMGLLTAGGPSAFFTPALYARVGKLNSDLHYQMDTELWWRFILSGARYRRLQDYTWALRLHADAKVSGHIYQDKGDARMQAIAAAQTAEARQISALVDRHQIGVNPSLKRAARVIKKTLTPSYVRSVAETRRWQGRHVNEVFAK